MFVIILVIVFSLSWGQQSSEWEAELFGDGLSESLIKEKSGLHMTSSTEDLIEVYINEIIMRKNCL